MLSDFCRIPYPPAAFCHHNEDFFYELLKLSTYLRQQREQTQGRSAADLLSKDIKASVPRVPCLALIGATHTLR